MQHLLQPRTFHYTPAEFYHLASQGGRETESEAEGRKGARQRESERDAASATIYVIPLHSCRDPLSTFSCRKGDRERDRGRASEMQHLQQSSSFHYTPAEILYLPSHGGRETESETEGERAGCGISTNLGHSMTLLPRSSSTF